MTRSNFFLMIIGFLSNPFKRKRLFKSNGKWIVFLPTKGKGKIRSLDSVAFREWNKQAMERWVVRMDECLRGPK